MIAKIKEFWATMPPKAKAYWVINGCVAMLVFCSTVMDINSVLDRRGMHEVTEARQRIGLTIIKAMSRGGAFSTEDKKTLCANWERAQFVEEKCPQ